MGHEIFFKVFPHVFFFFFFQVKGFGAQNIQISDQGDLRKTKHAK